MVQSFAAWMTLGCLAAAHLVGVYLRVPPEDRMGRSLFAALAGLLVGVAAAMLFRRFGPSLEPEPVLEDPAAESMPQRASEERE